MTFKSSVDRILLFAFIFLAGSLIAAFSLISFASLDAGAVYAGF